MGKEKFAIVDWFYLGNDARKMHSYYERCFVKR